MVNRKDFTLLVLGEKTREELPVRSRDLVYVSHDPLHHHFSNGPSLNPRLISGSDGIHEVRARNNYVGDDDVK